MQLVECPSIYEMLPNPAFNWKKQPQIHVWRKTDDDSIQMDSYGPTKSVTLFEEALKDNEVLINIFTQIFSYIYIPVKLLQNFNSIPRLTIKSNAFNIFASACALIPNTFNSIPRITHFFFFLLYLCFCSLKVSFILYKNTSVVWLID